MRGAAALGTVGRLGVQTGLVLSALAPACLVGRDRREGRRDRARNTRSQRLHGLQCRAIPKRPRIASPRQNPLPSPRCSALKGRTFCRRAGDGDPDVASLPQYPRSGSASPGCQSAS